MEMSIDPDELRRDLSLVAPDYNPEVMTDEWEQHCLAHDRLTMAIEHIIYAYENGLDPEFDGEYDDYDGEPADIDDDSFTDPYTGASYPPEYY